MFNTVHRFFLSFHYLLVINTYFSRFPSIIYLFNSCCRPHTRWSTYFLKLDNKGPTVGVPYDYVVPASAVTELVPTRVANW